MNDSHMSFLANDRMNSYRAEADRQRLAWAARRAAQPQRSQRSRSPIRLGLRQLLGRAAA